MKFCSFRRIFLNMLSITGILLIVVLNNLIIYDKNETVNEGVYPIYRRNLSEYKNVNNRGLKNTVGEKNKLKNTVGEKNKLKNTVDEKTKLKNTVDEKTKLKNTVDEKTKLKNPVGEKNKLKNTVDEKNKLKNTVDEKNKLKNTVDEKNKLKNTIDEKNNNIPPISECSNSEDDVKYNDDTTEEKCININYKDISKQLTLEEFQYVLDNLKERPSNEDLYKLWNHALSASKEGFDDMVKKLKLYIKDYLDKYEYQSYHYFSDRTVSIGTEYRTWYKSMNDIGVTLSSTDMEHTHKFYNLIKDGASIEEIKNFIYSFLKDYDTLKNDLYNEHKKIFTERMKNPKRLDM
ncbi:Plasmodium exported protein (PHISTa), unknown function [Plasmodium sp. gorilla clade G3]|nr:Plasmodium exported protein (PHISTa), unknown function [Plasmodium sp. gorilla clade G3]